MFAVARHNRACGIIGVAICLCLLIVGRAHAFSTVVIDAGHGGKDPGCHWNGLVEKDLCLDVAKRLSSILQGKGVKTVMTRTDDTYVELSERAGIANRHEDAIFVSIHFNASRDHGVSGFEVHHRSKKGLALAQCIEKSMGDAVKGRRRDGDWQDYKVLRETQATAVLVECGFISNKGEAARCADSRSSSGPGPGNSQWHSCGKSEAVALGTAPAPGVSRAQLAWAGQKSKVYKS